MMARRSSALMFSWIRRALQRPIQQRSARHRLAVSPYPTAAITFREFRQTNTESPPSRSMDRSPTITCEPSLQHSGKLRSRPTSRQDGIEEDSLLQGKKQGNSLVLIRKCRILPKICKFLRETANCGD